MSSNLVIVFSKSYIVFLFLVNYSMSEDSDLICNQTTDEFDSIFMLGGDTFFKIKDKIWRMNSTRLSKPIKLRPMSWEKTVRLKNFENDIRLGTTINISQPIFAFDYQYRYRNVCDDEYLPNECSQHSPFSRYSFVCLYGFEKANERIYTRKTFVFSYDNQYEYTPIFEIPLRLIVQGYCQRIVGHLFDNLKCDQSLLTGWTQMNKEGSTLYEFFMCRSPELEYLVHLQFNLDINSNDMHINNSEYVKTGIDKGIGPMTPKPLKNSTGIVIPMAFDTEVFAFKCFPKKCHIWNSLDSSIFRLINPKHPVTLEHYNISEELSVWNVLRCPNAKTLQLPLFTPNYICHQKTFDSIFSLGDDIYFQNKGRFWRYYYLSSTNESNPRLTDKGLNIRYDSYTSTLLRRFFDTSKPVMGFTLKVPEVCDKYGPPHKYNCPVSQVFRYKLELTCLYGYLKSQQYTTFPFINTPAGIKVFPITHIHYRESQHRCEKVIEMFVSDDFGESESGLTDRISFSSIATTDVLLSKDYQSINHTFLIHIYFRYNLTFASKWVHLSIEFKPIVGNLDLHHKIDYNPGHEKVTQHNGVFYCKPKDVWVYFLRADLDKVYMHTYATIIGTDLNTTLTLDKFMKCLPDSLIPEMDHSLVPIQFTYDWMCSPNLFQETSVYSILNIGEYVYVQTLQLFNRYIDYEQNKYFKGFVYDKQVSELINDIFDTTERVIGFSYLYGNHKDPNRTKYRVVLMGKPRLHIEQIFRSEAMYRVFEKELGPYAPLVPINKLPPIEGKMKYPFDTVENRCNSSDLTMICSKGISIIGKHNYHTINAMAFLQIYDINFPKYKIHSEMNYGLYPSFHAIIIDNNTFIMSTDGTQFFKPILNLEMDYQFKGRTPWKKVFGMFSFHDTLYIVAIAKNAKEPKIYQTSHSVPLFQDESWGEQPNLFHEGIDWRDITTTWNMGGIDQTFDCKTVPGLKSNRSSPAENQGHSTNALVFLFVFLIVILFITIILIGFMLYFMYGSQKRKSETKEDKNDLQIHSSFLETKTK